MMGYLSFKNYVMFGIGTAFICYFFGLVAGNVVAVQLNSLRRSALAAGLPRGLDQVILDPIIWAFSGDAMGAVVAGVVWPILLFWFILVVFVIAFTIIGTGLGLAGQQISR